MILNLEPNPDDLDCFELNPNPGDLDGELVGFELVPNPEFDFVLDDLFVPNPVLFL